jgi:hypothetical protein
MLYIFKEGEFIRRGSPAGPSEASVYAYTKVKVFSIFEPKVFDKTIYKPTVYVKTY